MTDIELRAHMLAVEFVKLQYQHGTTPISAVGFAAEYKRAYEQMVLELSKPTAATPIPRANPSGYPR